MVIRGIKSVVRNIQELNKQIETGVQKAQLRAALEIEREAALNVRVDTGRLKNSIMTEEVEDSQFVGVAKVAPVGGANFETGSSVEYAEAIEYRYPFLQPAVEKIRQKYPSIIIEDVNGEIR